MCSTVYLIFKQKIPPVTALLYEQHIFLGTSQPEMWSHLKAKKDCAKLLSS
jgi:hypothetical protein